MSASVELVANELQDVVTAVETLGDEISGEDVKRVMGNAIWELLRKHFADLANDEAHHKTARTFGVQPTGVYEEARAGTHLPEVDSAGVSISINQVAIAQRLFGGDIEPVNAKFLAIPARSEAYGKRPKEFDNLQAIIFPSGAGVLAENKATVLRGGKRGAGAGRRKGEKIGGGVYFWLVKQVHQEPDPTVLPDEEEMLDVAMTEAQRAIEEVWNEGAKVAA